MSTVLRTLKAADIESLYNAIEKAFVTLLSCSLYRVAVETLTFPQSPHYNQGYPARVNIYLLDSDDDKYAYFDLVCKTDRPLVGAYDKKPGGNGS